MDEKQKIKQALIKKILGELGDQFASKKEFEQLSEVINSKFDDTIKQFDLSEKFDQLLVSLEKRWEAQFTKNVTVEVPANIVFEGLTKELQGLLSELKSEIEKTQLPETVKVIIADKPKWYKDPFKSVTVEKLPPIKVEGIVQTKSDITGIAMLLSEFFSNLVNFLTSMAQKTFKVMLNKEHYLTPQYVVMIDPKTMKPVSPQDIGAGTFNQFVSQGIASGPRNVGVRGANTINDGTTTVTTAGTRVQLPDVQCSRVYVQSAPGNTGDIVVGGANVIASAGTRRGLALFSSQWQAFEVDNLNKLYIDSTADGDKINYIYEYFA